MGIPKTIKSFGILDTFEEATGAKGRYSLTPGACERVLKNRRLKPVAT
jgi:hypothetical protein